jgi:hypothetical protein
VLDSNAADYISSLPEVDTARLPKGTLFWAQDRLYQVVETGASGYHKAREWRKTETTDVALVPGSFLSRVLPLIKRGRVLPVYRSRIELTLDGQPSCFVFPTESLALDCAYLDVALIQSSGAYVRNQGHDPAFAVTDGAHAFRLYYYRQTIHNRPTDLASLRQRPLPFNPQAHVDGPRYWCLLPNWTEVMPSSDMTQTSMPAVNPLPDSGDTVPHSPPGMPPPPAT